jgi:hypothetical protein
MLEHKASRSQEPTLRKLGAHLRWFIEKSGVEPEHAVVCINVHTTEEQSKLISRLLSEFDGTTMTRRDEYSQLVVVHGVPLWICVIEKLKRVA